MKNPIQEWINSDSKLFNLIVKIQDQNESPEIQAELAFKEISDLYNIPKMPEDVIQKKDSISRSLFEEHALIKFLAPKNEDPRGLVLSAVYNIINRKTIDYIEIANKEYKGNLPELSQIGIRGNNFNSEVVFFEKETNDWTELGCKTIVTINKK